MPLLESHGVDGAGGADLKARSTDLKAHGVDLKAHGVDFKARSAYAFIAVCDSARLMDTHPVERRVAVLHVMFHRDLCVRFSSLCDCGTAMRRMFGVTFHILSVGCRTRL